MYNYAVFYLSIYVHECEQLLFFAVFAQTCIPNAALSLCLLLLFLLLLLLQFNFAVSLFLSSAL